MLLLLLLDMAVDVGFDNDEDKDDELLATNEDDDDDIPSPLLWKTPSEYCANKNLKSATWILPTNLLKHSIPKPLKNANGVKGLNRKGME